MKNRRNTNQARRMAGFTCALLLAALGACLPNVGHVALAATFISDNDGNWGTPATWNPDPGVPGPGDEVFANHTIIVEADHACWKLHLNKYIGVLSGYTLTIGGGVCGEEGGPVQLTGGGGALLNQGVFGTSANYPGLSINPGFTWRNQGAFHHSIGTLTVSGTWRNEPGGAVYRSGGALTLAGAWHNEAGSTYDLQTDGALATGAGTFWNCGLLRKSGGAGTATLSCPYNDEGGTVEVLSGTLLLAGGGAYSNTVFNVAAGAALDLTGGKSPLFAGRLTGTGQGWVGWSSGGPGENSSVTFDFPHGLHWAGGLHGNWCFLRNNGLLIIEGDSTKTSLRSALDNYGTIWQTNRGPLRLDMGGNFAYLNNYAGAVYDIQSDGTNIVGASLYPGLNEAVYNYGLFRKSGGDGESRVTAVFCNLGGTVEVQRGTLVLAGGGSSTNGAFQVAAGASLDLTGGKYQRYGGTFTGTGAGRVGWSSGGLEPCIPLVFDFPNGGVYWGGGRLWNNLRNNGLMILEGDTQKENFISTLDNYGTIRQTNSGPLYLNKFNNTCYLQNRAGALYELQSDGTNITGSTSGDVNDAVYNYGTFRKSGGDGVSRLTAAFCNYGGTVEVQRGTLVLAGGGVSSNGVFNVAAGASLDFVGGSNPQFYGTFSGSGAGWIGWNSGSIQPNSAVVFDFPSGVHWGGGRFWGYIRNNGLMVIEGDGQKESFISVLDNYGTIRQTNSGPLYLNKFNNTCYLQNRPGALYEIQSDGTNITGSTSGNIDDAVHNYGMFRKSGGDGVSRLTAAFCNYGGTVEVQRGTLVLAGGGVQSNAVFAVTAGAVLDLTGGSRPLFAGRLTGAGLGWIGWSSGGPAENSSVTFDFPYGLHWAGGLHGNWCQLRNYGLMILEGAATKTSLRSALHNYGTMLQTNSGPLRLDAGGNFAYLNNYAGGLYEIVDDGISIEGSGQFTNYSTFRKSGGSGVSQVTAAFINQGGTVDAAAGTLQFSTYTHNNGLLRLGGGNVSLPSCTLNGGSLQGTGTVSVAGTLTSFATVAPGLSAGTLNLVGNFTQTASGTLAIELAGRNPGEFDQLNVSGNVSLNGTLQVTLRPPFLAVPGDQFRVISCANRTGVFSVTNVPAGLAVSYDSTGVSLVVTGAVPPYLLIARTATNAVVVSWPLAGAEGWVLEATNALPGVAVPWPVISPPYQTNGANLQFIEPSPVGNKFYRLHKPRSSNSKRKT